jgi:GNAT superfamily N-acetyltransferase
MTIRPYRADDRDRVRHICFATGLMGDPVAGQWRDEASFADMFSSYYTDVEPGSASVVEIDGIVSGYLLGCVDGQRAFDPARVALRHIVRRGIAVRPGTAGIVWRTAFDGVGDLARRRVRRDDLDFRDQRWPAHLHIDLLPEARGSGAGRLLIAGWLERLRSGHVPGCHLTTFAENTAAIAFFTSIGFRPHGDAVLAPGLRTHHGERLHTQVFVIDL